MPAAINAILARPGIHFFLLAALLSALFGFGLGERPYSAPSESRYVEIGREMAESGDMVTPRLNYVKYFEKPPLLYWVEAASIRHFGLNPFAARLPTAFFALCLCLLTYALGAMLYGVLAGWISAAILATSLYMFALSRIVLVDVPVSFFIAATLTAFLYAVRKPDGALRAAALYAMYVAAACAVLTKGLIGIVLPGGVVFLWLAITGRWKLLCNMKLVSGSLILILLSMPWHVLVSLRNPEFPHFYFIHEHFERYLTTQHGRYQPVWFFAVVLLAGIFPWITFALQSLYNGLTGFWEARKDDGSQLFLIVWCLFIFIFFSLSDSKLIPYILPIFPPIAALIGRYMAAGWREESAPYFGAGLFAMIVLLMVAAVTPSLLMQQLDPESKVVAALRQGGDSIRDFSIIAMICSAALLVTHIQCKRRYVVIMMLVAAACIVQAGDRIAAHYGKDSMQRLAGYVKAFDMPGDEVVLFDEYYQDLPVYLARKVSLVSWKKTELHFGAEHQDAGAWMIDEKEFWRRWLHNDHRMFVIMREEDYKRLIADKKPEAMHLYALFQDGRNLLFMNQMPDEQITRPALSSSPSSTPNKESPPK